MTHFLNIDIIFSINIYMIMILIYLFFFKALSNEYVIIKIHEESVKKVHLCISLHSGVVHHTQGDTHEVGEVCDWELHWPVTYSSMALEKLLDLS